MRRGSHRDYEQGAERGTTASPEQETVSGVSRSIRKQRHVAGEGDLDTLGKRLAAGRTGVVREQDSG